jgi:hypothetical protein
MAEKNRRIRMTKFGRVKGPVILRPSPEEGCLKNAQGKTTGMNGKLMPPEGVATYAAKRKPAVP